MTRFIFTCIISFFVHFQFEALAQENPRCKISTALGEIELELFSNDAPQTVTNFLAYVNHHLYDSSRFFRVCTPENEADREIKIQVIQGGDVPEGRELPPIAIETTEMTGIQHKNGTISMARAEPNTATSSFFICIGDQPELDFGGKRNPDGFGFAAFGKVTSGMDVVLKIQKMEEKGQYLVNPVLIFSITKLD